MLTKYRAFFPCLLIMLMFHVDSGRAEEASANPMAGLFNELESAVKQHVDSEEPSQAKGATPEAKSKRDAGVQSHTVEAHEYEGALRPDDYACATIVEPFGLAQNVTELLGAPDIESLVTLFKTRDKVSLLDTAKQKAKRMNWMPMAVERQYGARLHEQKVAADAKFIPRGDVGRVKRQYDKADALLKRVLSAIAEDHPYEFKLYLLNSSRIQGHAAPGGYIYLSTAALDSEYADMVLAHEIAHVLKRHQTRELQAQLIDTVATVDELKKLIKIDQSTEAAYADQLLHLTGLFLNFSRQQELQADACSVRIAGRLATGDVQHRVASYARELEKAGTSGKERLFSVHASYPDRSKRMEEVAISMEQEREGAN